MDIVWIHADDFGLSKSINTAIIRCCEEGALNSLSVIPNGYAFEEAMRWYQSSDVSVAVHLNFLEGKPVSGLSHPNFTDRDGDFERGFLYHLYHSKRLKGVERKDYNEFLRVEMRAQIEKVRAWLKPGSPLRVDSHQHLHMIPGWFSVLMELAEEFPIDMVRIPDERPGPASSTLNYIKWKLLQRLVSINKEKIKDKSYEFCGILHTGKMKAELARKVVRDKKEGVLEVLFHPGQAAASEKEHWKKYPSLWKYYTSPARAEEATELVKLKSAG